MTMDKLVQTLETTYHMAYRGETAGSRNPGLVQCHKEAELLIITGNDDEINLVRSTLAAISEKVMTDKARQAQATVPVHY
jgi:hypothetical protein